MHLLCMRQPGLCCAAGTYKWIVYGDDDTVMFVDNILRTLNSGVMDWRDPYFVSDCLWWPEGGSGAPARASKSCACQGSMCRTWVQGCPAHLTPPIWARRAHILHRCRWAQHL